MKRTLISLPLFAALASTIYAQSSTKMWGCKPPGQRRNVLVLVDRGAQSYVKFNGQRVSAQLTNEDGLQRWSWGSNAVVLSSENVARYFEGDTVKARFKCKRLGGD